MKASPAQQRELLTMQECDTKLARLTYDAQHLPEHETLVEVTARRDDLTRTVATLQSQLGDQKRELTKIVTDMERLTSRRALTQDRLDRGLGDMKELQHMQEELETIARRVKVVEDQQLEVEEQLETLESTLAKSRVALVALNEDVVRLTDIRNNKLAELKSQAQPLIDRRREAMQLVGKELTEEYDAIRARTGGLGAVALRGKTVEGMSIQFTPTEWDRIRNAPADEVLTSEDMEWILVRVED